MRRHIVLLVVALVFLAGCSGIESGTGDQSPPTPTEEDTPPQSITDGDMDRTRTTGDNTKLEMVHDTFYTSDKTLDSPLVDGGVTIAANRVHFADIVTDRDGLDRFNFDRFDNESTADFVRETDFERTSLVVVQTIVQPGCDLVVEEVTKRGDRAGTVSVSLECPDGENAAVRSVGTLLVRVDASVSDATVKLHREGEVTMLDPDTGTTTNTTN